MTYRFGAYEVDAGARQLRRDGQRLPLSDRYVSVLLHLAEHPGVVVSKDDLVSAAWGNVAVGDNSLEQAISALRRLFNSHGEDCAIETVSRQGYRFSANVQRLAPRVSDEALDALLSPYRALVEGRAALETLEAAAIVRARDVFTQVVTATPDAAPAHIGLANACVLQFEMTRAQESSDTDALALATRHAYEACRLDTGHGEAWATLGFVLERTGNHIDALAAGRRAIALQPDNWRHHLRLASIAWGDERLSGARRALALLPGLALAHWLAASVFVARQMLPEAERELGLGVAAERTDGAEARFSGVALHWLLGLIALARGDDAQAMREFECELANESGGHLYATECCANTWYAIGAMHLRRGNSVDAQTSFARALERVPRHPMARVGAALAGGQSAAGLATGPGATPGGNGSFESILCVAAGQVSEGNHAAAARLVDDALAAAAPSSAAWLLPVEPMLAVATTPDAWSSPLARLRVRAA